MSLYNPINLFRIHINVVKLTNDFLYSFSEETVGYTYVSCCFQKDEYKTTTIFFWANLINLKNSLALYNGLKALFISGFLWFCLGTDMNVLSSIRIYITTTFITPPTSHNPLDDEYLN
jgi:hypothetical protein